MDYSFSFPVNTIFIRLKQYMEQGVILIFYVVLSI